MNHLTNLFYKKLPKLPTPCVVLQIRKFYYRCPCNYFFLFFFLTQALTGGRSRKTSKKPRRKTREAEPGTREAKQPIRSLQCSLGILRHDRRLPVCLVLCLKSTLCIEIFTVMNVLSIVLHVICYCSLN